MKPEEKIKFITGSNIYKNASISFKCMIFKKFRLLYIPKAGDKFLFDGCVYIVIEYLRSDFIRCEEIKTGMQNRLYVGCGDMFPVDFYE